MRTKGEIIYPKSMDSIFYTIGSIKDLLNANAIQSSYEYVNELCKKLKTD